MKRKIILLISLIVGTGIILYLLRECELTNPNKIKINQDVYLVHKNQSFSIYCSQNSNGIYKTYYHKLVATKVDTIIISYKYGTIFHGYHPSKNKSEWFYIDVSPGKNIHDDFENIVEVTSSTMGKTYIDSTLTAEEVWEKYN